MSFMWRCLVVVSVLSYLLGCFNGAILTAKYRYQKDIRDFGSNNAGLSNFYRTFGSFDVPYVIFADILKGVVSVLAGYALLEPFEMAKIGMLTAMLFCMLGHMFPAFFEFRGGKGVLTAGFSAIIFDWRAGLCIMAIFVVCVAATRYISLGSVLGGGSFFLFVILFGYGRVECILAGCCSALIVYMHRANIGRLLRGEERKLDFKKERKVKG